MTEFAIDRATYTNLKASVGDEFMAELVGTYLADAPAQITAMRAALASSDAESFRRAAHSLKSTSLNFGAAALAEQARVLEYFGRDQRLDQVGDALNRLDECFRQVSEELMRLQNG